MPLSLIVILIIVILFLIAERSILSRVLFAPYSDTNLLNSLTCQELAEKYKEGNNYYNFDCIEIFGSAGFINNNEIFRVRKVNWIEENLKLRIELDNDCCIDITGPSKIEERLDRLVFWRVTKVSVIRHGFEQFYMEMSDDEMRFNDINRLFNKDLKQSKYYPAVELCCFG